MAARCWHVAATFLLTTACRGPDPWPAPAVSHSNSDFFGPASSSDVALHDFMVTPLRETLEEIGEPPLYLDSLVDPTVSQYQVLMVSRTYSSVKATLLRLQVGPQGAAIVTKKFRPLGGPLHGQFEVLWRDVDRPIADEAGACFRLASWDTSSNMHYDELPPLHTGAQYKQLVFVDIVQAGGGYRNQMHEFEIFQHPSMFELLVKSTGLVDCVRLILDLAQVANPFP